MTLRSPLQMDRQPLSSSHEAYSYAFQIFIEKATLREVIRNCCINVAAHIMQKRAPQTRNNQIFCVLGVGSGDGKHDIEILKVVARGLRSRGEHQKPLMHACIVEPSSSLNGRFQTIGVAIARRAVNSG